MPAESTLNNLRERYHHSICNKLLGYWIKDGKPTGSLSKADSSRVNTQDLSVAPAAEISFPHSKNVPSGQSTGSSELVT